MTYAVLVDGREIAVEVREAGGGVVVVVDGREFPAALLPLGAGAACGLRVGDRSLTVVVADRAEGMTVTLGAREYRVRVEDERERAAHAVRPPHADGPRILRSVMPGIVREILVAEGAAVEGRAPLLVLEAMKMQNEIRADRACSVLRVHVAVGSTVARGDPLLTLG